LRASKNVRAIDISEDVASTPGAVFRTVVGVGTVVGTVVVLGALVVGALIVSSVVATAPPLVHAVITSTATTSPAGLNLIVIRRPPEERGLDGNAF
jgi:hypothetical protein